MVNISEIRVAIVGLSVGHAGSIGPENPSIIHNLRQMDGVEVVAYCESEKPEILKDAEIHHPEANTYTDVKDLIDKEDFDMALVVLVPRELPRVCIQLAEAGKHMFIDKQFARTSEELIPVVKAVRKNGVKTGLGYPWSYHPAMRDLKNIVLKGILGRPLDIECRQVWWKAGPGGKDPTLPCYQKDTEGGGALHFVGSHLLELMRNLMGCEVKSVQAMTGRPVGAIEEPLEDIAILAMEYENGAYGSLHTAYTKPNGLGSIDPKRTTNSYDSAMVYRGLEGWANWTPVGDHKMEVFSAIPEWSGAPERVFEYDLAPLEKGYGNKQWMQDWIESFIDAIRTNQDHYTTIEDGLHILQLIDAAYQSARTGNRVDVTYGTG